MGYQSLTTFSTRAQAIQGWNKRSDSGQEQPKNHCSYHSAYFSDCPQCKNMDQDVRDCETMFPANPEKESAK